MNDSDTSSSMADTFFLLIEGELGGLTLAFGILLALFSLGIWIFARFRKKRRVAKIAGVSFLVGATIAFSLLFFRSQIRTQWPDDTIVNRQGM